MAGVASGQDACVSLLQHGIYDHFREINVHASASEMYSNVCSTYDSYKKDQQSGQVSAQYGLFGGEIQLSRDQIESIGQTMCNIQRNAATASSQLQNARDVISAPAVQAFSDCVALYSDGVRTTTTFREDDQNELTIDVRYVAPPGAGPTTKLNGITIAGDLMCSGPLWNMHATGGVIGNADYGMSCVRSSKQTAYMDEGHLVYASPATVTLYVSAAPAISRTLTYKLAGPPPTPLVLPIGTIIAFSGSMVDAEAQVENGWWVCDGRVVNDVASPAYNGHSTPNLTDKFLRAASAAGTLGGAAFFDIPDQQIKVWTDSFDYQHRITQDPALTVHGNSPWVNGGSIVSLGTFHGLQAATIPPYYSVIYLVKVK